MQIPPGLLRLAPIRRWSRRWRDTLRVARLGLDVAHNHGNAGSTPVPAIVRLVQQQNASLTSRKRGCDSLTGHPLSRGCGGTKKTRSVESRVGFPVEVQVLSAALSGDMGRQRPTCFGNRQRPGASPGSPIRIPCPRGVADARRGPNAQVRVRLPAGVPRPGGVADASESPKLEGKVRLLPGTLRPGPRGVTDARDATNVEVEVRFLPGIFKA